MLQMLYLRASEQKRFLDIRRRFTNKKYIIIIELLLWILAGKAKHVWHSQVRNIGAGATDWEWGDSVRPLGVLQQGRWDGAAVRSVPDAAGVSPAGEVTKGSSQVLVARRFSATWSSHVTSIKGWSQVLGKGLSQSCRLNVGLVMRRYRFSYKGWSREV